MKQRPNISASLPTRIFLPQKLPVSLSKGTIISFILNYNAAFNCFVSARMQDEQALTRWPSLRTVCRLMCCLEWVAMLE